jgi:hypothetical protein
MNPRLTEEYVQRFISKQSPVDVVKLVLSNAAHYLPQRTKLKWLAP